MMKYVCCFLSLFPGETCIVRATMRDDFTPWLHVPATPHVKLPPFRKVGISANLWDLLTWHCWLLWKCMMPYGISIYIEPESRETSQDHAQMQRHPVIKNSSCNKKSCSSSPGPDWCQIHFSHRLVLDACLLSLDYWYKDGHPHLSSTFWRWYCKGQALTHPNLIHLIISYISALLLWYPRCPVEVFQKDNCFPWSTCSFNLCICMQWCICIFRYSLTYKHRNMFQTFRFRPPSPSNGYVSECTVPPLSAV